MGRKPAAAPEDPGKSSARTIETSLSYPRNHDARPMQDRGRTRKYSFLAIFSHSDAFSPHYLCSYLQRKKYLFLAPVFASVRLSPPQTLWLLIGHKSAKIAHEFANGLQKILNSLIISNISLPRRLQWKEYPKTLI